MLAKIPTINNRFGRLWITAKRGQFYNYRQGNWENLQLTYPYLPSSVYSLNFTDRYNPIIYNKGGSDLQRLWYRRNNNWHLLSSTRTSDNATFNEMYAQIRIDKFNRLWGINGSAVRLWQGNQMHHIQFNDFFPQTFFQDVFPYHRDTVYFHSGLQLTKYYGNDYQHIDINEFLPIMDDPFTTGRDHDIGILPQSSLLSFSLTLGTAP